MKSARWLLALAMMLVASASARAQGDPLRYVPAQADVVVKIGNPGRIADTFYKHEAVTEWLKIDVVRELFDTTNYRRLQQLIAYYEKKLGVSGTDLLDKVAGGGAVFAARFQNPPAVMLIIESKDEAILKQFVKLTADIAGQELARAESKEKLEPRKFAGYDGYVIGKGCFALVGPSVIFASDPIVLEMAIGTANKKSKGVVELPQFTKAQATMPKDAFVWTWLNLDSARQVQGFKDGINALSMDPNAIVLFGGLVDVLQRSQFLTASVGMEKQNLSISVSMPAGREGMSERAALYLPTDEQGSLPLLSPPRALASFSFFFDLKAFWDNRAKLLNKQQLKGLEDFDATSGRFLGGTKMSTLLQQSGPHQRIVVAQQAKSPYKTKSQQAIPAFALVQEMRDPAFGKSMNTVLRAAGILGAFTFNVKMVEEKRGEHTVVAYYFPEDKKFPGDVNNIRYAFSPTFVTVNNQLILSSTAELARELVDIVDKEKPGNASPATTQFSLSSTGAAQALRDNRDQLLAQAILAQALPPAEANQQLDALIRFVERLGEIRFDVRYDANQFRYGINWLYK